MEFTVKVKRVKDGQIKTSKEVLSEDCNISRYNETFSKFYPKSFSAYAIYDSKGEVLFSKGQF